MSQGQKEENTRPELLQVEPAIGDVFKNIDTLTEEKYTPDEKVVEHMKSISELKREKTMTLEDAR